jgi:hypothetical protein
MAPPHDRAPIIIGLLFVVVLQAGAIALYANFVFDARYTCDRASDSCQVERVRLFWREAIEQFRPSELVKASWVSRGKGFGHLALEMAGGTPEIRIEMRDGGELATHLSEFIADPAQPRFRHVVEPHFAYALFSGFLQLVALILLYAALSEVIRRGRRAR